LPIISYGVIVFRHSDVGLQFLMIRRKDSFGYIDFIRGKYSPYNIEQIQKSVDEMANHEKERLLVEPFDTLWKMLWCDNSTSHYRTEEHASSKKFEHITNGVLIGESIVTLADIVEKSTTRWKETEWEFPKGRRNFQEKDLDCAVREFEEETGIPRGDILIIDNLVPFEEIYMGSNHKCYKHKYFLAYMNKPNESLDAYQRTEVSKIEWKTLDECLDSIRPYNLEKKQLIITVNRVLSEYRLYQ
jgi:8-oxo-dGTP pyrophosphatase MutT (NUDIX family)